MSVVTRTPVPQMQLHTIFTELHIQVRPDLQDSGCGRRPAGEMGGAGGASPHSWAPASLFAVASHPTHLPPTPSSGVRQGPCPAAVRRPERGGD